MPDNFPKYWKLLSVEECVAAIIDYRGKTPKKTHFGIPLVTAKIVKGGRILPHEEYISPDVYDSWMRRGLPQPGDVVITTEAPLGEVAQLGDLKVALAQRLITLRGKPDLMDNTYLKFAMQSTFVQSQLRSRSSGTTVLGIRQSELQKVRIPIPPLPEQHVIAHILGTLDDKIELNRQMNETLEAMAQALFKNWFVDFESFLDQGMEDSPLGPIPKGWRAGKLSDLCKTQYGYTASATEEPVGPHLLRVTDINKQNWIEWTSVPYCQISDEDKPKYALEPGDLVVARMADPGKSAIIEQTIDAIFASYLVRLKTESLAHAYYVYGFLKSQTYAEYAEGAGGGSSVQKTMNAKMIVDVNLVIPPLPILEVFLKRVLPLRRRLVDNVEQSTTLASVRDTLLPKLLSGEIRVKDAERFVENKA